MRYSDGLQICWGTYNIPAGSGTVTVNFPLSFSAAPIVTITEASGGSSSTSYYNSGILKGRYTSYFQSKDGLDESTNYCYIAIGRWK